MKKKKKRRKTKTYGKKHKNNRMLKLLREAERLKETCIRWPRENPTLFALGNQSVHESTLSTLCVLIHWSIWQTNTSERCRWNVLLPTIRQCNTSTWRIRALADTGEENHRATKRQTFTRLTVTAKVPQGERDRLPLEWLTTTRLTRAFDPLCFAPLCPICTFPCARLISPPWKFQLCSFPRAGKSTSQNRIFLESVIKMGLIF